MSAPDANIEKQKKNHKGPIIGISAALIFVAALFMIFVGNTVDEGGVPEGAEVQIDGRTGAQVDAETGEIVTE